VKDVAGQRWPRKKSPVGGKHVRRWRQLLGLNNSIRAKLLFGFGFAIAVGISQAVVVLWYVQRETASTYWATRTHEVLERVHATRQDVSAMESAYRGFLITGSDDFLEPYEAGRRQARENLVQLQELAATDAQRQRWSKISELVERWEKTVARPGIRLKRSYADGVMSWVKDGSGEQHTDALVAAFEEAIRFEQSLLAAQTKESEEAQALLPWIMICGALLSAIVGMSVTFVLARGISSPLRQLTARARQVGEGNFSLGAIDVRSNDEIGQLSIAINDMIQTLCLIDQQTQAIARGEIDAPSLNKEVPGEIGQAHGFMVARLLAFTRTLEAVGRGDYSTELAPASHNDSIGRAAGGLIASLRQKEEDLVARERERDHLLEQQTFEARLNRSLELAQTESDVLRVFREATRERLPDVPVELLMSPEGQSQDLVSIAQTNDNGSASCSVSEASGCAAVRGGRSLAFSSSVAFDACPRLRDNCQEDVATACIPLSVMGSIAGVVRASGSTPRADSPDVLKSLELISGRTGERLSVVRAFARSNREAMTDPLTGLRNRRSIENDFHFIEQGEKDYAVCFCDLDLFKKLNDTHGHEAGDHALQVFAEVLKSSCRPSDLTARWGGEEFVLVLPGASAQAAVDVLERVRSNLQSALKRDSGPAFTASFGVAAATAGEPLPVVVSRADEALYAAKENGRNRIEVAGAAQDLGAEATA